MLQKFNLLISTSRGNERRTCKEIWYLLNELGDKNPEVDVTPAVGLIVAYTSIKPFKAISGFREILGNRPWEIRYALRITPIEKNVQADILKIKKIALKLAAKIKPDESYRVTVRKRHSDLRSKDIIDALAPDIPRKVNLNNPSKILLVDILSSIAGISLIEPDSYLSIEKEKENTKQVREEPSSR
ncbi:THUMP domain-containing protein [[Eubacterium] cellulosolvens]